MKRSGWFSALQNLSFLTQFGLSVASPLVLCLLCAAWIVKRFGVGTWVYLPALILGLGGGACAFLEFIKLVQRKANAKNGKNKEQ